MSIPVKLALFRLLKFALFGAIAYCGQYLLTHIQTLPAIFDSPAMTMFLASMVAGVVKYCKEWLRTNEEIGE